MRCLGLNPTEEQVQQLINQLDIDGNSTVDFSEFLYIIMYHMQDSEAEIKEAFKVFDKDGSGWISAAEFRLYLTHFGQTMSEKEVDELINFANCNGQLNYPILIDMILTEMSDENV